MSNRELLDKVALAASVHCENPLVDETQIDMFIEFLVKVYGFQKYFKNYE